MIQPLSYPLDRCKTITIATVTLDQSLSKWLRPVKAILVVDIKACFFVIPMVFFAFRIERVNDQSPRRSEAMSRKNREE